MGLVDFIEQINTKETTALHSTERKKTDTANNNWKVQILPAKPVKIKPEKLNFLRPCPICHERNFTYGKKGGFFCSTCQPGITGNLVYADGRERPKNHTTEPLETQTPIQKVSEQSRKAKQEAECFKKGFPWIMEHLDELLATGWTRPELFRRSCNRWCIGNWGLAWLSAWTRPGVTVSVDQKGRVNFSFTGGGRAIIQAAYPLKSCIKRG